MNKRSWTFQHWKRTDDDGKMVAHVFFSRGQWKTYVWFLGMQKMFETFKPNVSILRMAMTHKHREEERNFSEIVLDVAAAIVVIILKEPLKWYNCFKIDMDFIANNLIAKPNADKQMNAVVWRYATPMHCIAYCMIISTIWNCWLGALTVAHTLCVCLWLSVLLRF